VTSLLQLDPVAVLDGEVWRLLSYAFLHSTDTPWHILFNMLFLWWFGSDVEQLYGRKEFLAIYLISAFLGGVAYQAWAMTMHIGVPCIGASGAVTTMLVLCAFHYPRRIIYVFFVLPVPIWLFAVFNVLLDTFSLLGNGANSRVAFVVHLAGAAFAVAYYKWQGSITGWLSELMWWKHMRSRPRLKIFEPTLEKEEPVAVSAVSSAAAMDEHLEAKLDALLEKIARNGKESLTEQEQRILQQAAEMYKRRRT
jgi:membrane associated rhomboid family serine protease